MSKINEEQTVMKNRLIEFIATGDQMNAVAEALKLHDTGLDSETIVKDCIETAMVSLSDKCTAENFNLLEIMLSGRAVMSVMKKLFPPGLNQEQLAIEKARIASSVLDSHTQSEPDQIQTKGTVMLATLEGDVHDLGKNIVKMVLTGNRYQVVDCGKDCSIEKLLQTAMEENPAVIGISGLITSVIPLVKKIKPLLSQHDLEHIRVMAGGAALKQSTAGMLQVDYVGETAFDGVRYVVSCTGGTV